MGSRAAFEKTVWLVATCLAAFPFYQQLARPVPAPAPAAPVSQPGWDIIVIAGQSNAAGWGKGYDDETKSFTYTDDSDFVPYGDRVFQVGRHYFTKGTRDPNTGVTTLSLPDFSDDMRVIPGAQLMDHWLVFDGVPDRQAFSDKRVAFGFTFARRYAAGKLATNRNVLVVPTACGGSSLVRWDEDEHELRVGTVEQDAELYADMKARVLFALNLRPDGQGPLVAGQGENRIVAFLWHQGEADVYASAFFDKDDDQASHQLMASEGVYFARLRALFHSVRTDFGSQGDFPILLGEQNENWLAQYSGKNPELAGTNGVEAKGRIREADLRITTTISNAALVSGAGLGGDPEPGNDNIHYSAQSQIELGKRYFDTYESLVAASAAAPGPPLVDPDSISDLSDALKASVRTNRANGASCVDEYAFYVDNSARFADALRSVGVDDYANKLFEVFLRRSPTPAEKDRWRAILERNAEDRIATLRLFLAVPEVALVCKALGVE